MTSLGIFISSVQKELHGPFNAPEIRQLRHEHANRAAKVPMRTLKRLCLERQEIRHV